jgi:signal transduction histidine kinase
MKIRVRLTLWYAGMLLGSLLLMGGVLRYELVGEYERGRIPESPAEKISDILLFYGLPTVVVLILGGSWLIRRALRPVETLTAAAERVHAGNLSERIQGSGRDDELDRLAGVFNAMLARVEAGITSVREFTLHASHELKTPLTILSAETELALGNPALSAGERDRLTSLYEEIRRLAALVDALSLLAKVDAGLPIITREPLQLDELLRVAVDDARVLAGPQSITIELIGCDVVSLNGDRAGLRQVLLNLLGNAVKHNRTGGWVRVDLRSDPEKSTLSIENSGSSIPRELIPRIFDRFVRGPGEKEGSGLGLSITKTILDAHGATIACNNRPEPSVQFVVQIPRFSSNHAERNGRR